jgi:molybdopterin synthase catalytic subunit
MSKVIPHILVQSDDFDVATEVSRLTGSRTDIGAVVTFTGLCRDEAGSLAALELEHYPGMAEAEIARIAEQAIDRWPITGITAIHRVGKIKPGENIVLVAAASPHRDAAFNSAAFLMDFLKSDAPFWKKEWRKDGREGEWVSAKESDAKAAAKWRRP